MDRFKYGDLVKYVGYEYAELMGKKFSVASYNYKIDLLHLVGVMDKAFIGKYFIKVESPDVIMETKEAEESVNQFNNNKENTMATEKLTIELDVKQLGNLAKVKKEKTAKIVCKIDGELMEFKNEDALKAFMWTSRCNEVIRYDLAGKVSVPFELTTTIVK